MTRKIIALALAAATVAGAAAAQSGYNSLGTQATIPNSGLVQLDLVRAQSAGTLQIVDFHGNVLGSAPVNAGANGQVQIDIGGATIGPINAEIVVDGQVVATRTFNNSAR